MMMSIEMRLKNKIALLTTLKEYANGDKEKLKDLYTEFMAFLDSEV